MSPSELRNLTLYLEDVYQLKNITRYNTRNVLKKESVAEHSFYVALFCIKICNDYNLSKEVEHDAITKALLHDMPEIELNDITHDVKEKLNLRKFLMLYENDYYERHFNKYYAELMLKTDDVADSVVLLADTWSVLQYVSNEKALGNKSSDIEEIYDNAIARINDLRSKLEKKIEECNDEQNQQRI